MQIISFQNSFYFFGKIKDLKLFLNKISKDNLTVKEFITRRLQ